MLPNQDQALRVTAVRSAQPITCKACTTPIQHGPLPISCPHALAPAEPCRTCCAAHAPQQVLDHYWAESEGQQNRAEHAGRALLFLQQ